MIIKQIYKCKCCGCLFESGVKDDVNGSRYNLKEILEHRCSDTKIGFAEKVGYVVCNKID